MLCLTGFRRLVALFFLKTSKKSCKVLRIMGIALFQHSQYVLNVLHELVKAWRVLARVRQAFGGHGIQQLSGGVLFITEKTRVCGAQTQKCRFGFSYRLPHRRKQTFITDQLLHHEAHHLNTQGLTQCFGFCLELLTQQGYGQRWHDSGLVVSVKPGQPLRPQLTEQIHGRRHCVGKVWLRSDMSAELTGSMRALKRVVVIADQQAMKMVKRE